ncbi:MAG: hypothetical protein VB047_05385 [Anaerotignum propionicum]|jgi:hypothetical protein|uniref:hypothetical protein n=1 Tax=Anaerotignum propionicum TaxID=28446 RepID=UPI002B21320E|nr:hypothetical protein [Anaerotignum propionicum]MEA5056974.1 hypothetical protein [Anaerotignum propionicum]
MSFCPKCGREIFDESLGCPVCTLNESKNTAKADVEEAEAINEFTVEDKDGTSQKFQGESEARSWESYQSKEPKPVQEQVIPTVLKVITILLILFVGGIGQIAGLIAGVILLKSPIEDYSKFGKTLIIISSVMLGIWFLCCLIPGIFGFAGNMIYSLPYYY